MANRAIVVGCDAYPNLPGGDLAGAVADAMAVRDWLASASGGGISADRITFLASPSTAGAQPEAGTVAGPATIERFAEAVWDALSDEDAGEHDRLWLYLAGHGCRTDPLNPVLAQDAFAFTGFSRFSPGSGCVAVPDVVARLRQSRFGEIVLLLDACRDFPFRTAFQVGGLGLDPQPAVGRPYEPRVFILHSTLPGRVSKGTPTGVSQVVRGDFTVALLDGLAGAGTAKAYDESAERPYVVRWSSLAGYVEAAVPHQAPRGAGEGDLVLATFPDGSFDPVTLTVDVTPGELGVSGELSVNVRYTDPTAAFDPEDAATGPVPVTFSVPPRRQHVIARSGTSWGRVATDAYADVRVTVSMYPGGPPRSPVPSMPVVRSIKEDGAVEIEADDPLTVVRVCDSSGRILLSGVGRLKGPLPPGTYTAMFTGANGRSRAEPFDIEPRIVTRFPGNMLDALLWSIYEPIHDVGEGPRDPVSELLRVAHDIRQRRGWFDLAVTGAEQSLLASEAVVVVEAPEGSGLGGQADRLVRLRQLVDGEPAWLLPESCEVTRMMGGWFTVGLGEHSLTVPWLPDASTVVMLGGDRLRVAVFDCYLQNAPMAEALIDRGQDLLAAGQPGAAAAVLRAAADQLRPYGPPLRATAALLRAAEGDPRWHGLAAGIAPADAAGLLGTGPWAAFVDRPVDQPPSTGDLATLAD
jgi:hypothetical protein